MHDEPDSTERAEQPQALPILFGNLVPPTVNRTVVRGSWSALGNVGAVVHCDDLDGASLDLRSSKSPAQSLELFEADVANRVARWSPVPSVVRIDADDGDVTRGDDSRPWELRGLMPE